MNFFTTSLAIGFGGFLPLFYVCTSGPIYAGCAYRALGVQIDAPGCVFNNGIHKGEIISITLLDKAWYGFEQCNFVLQCANCHLQCDGGPITSMIIKYLEMTQAAGIA